MIDWKRKLSSRKFWVAIVGLVTGLLLLFGVDKTQTEQIGGIILTAGTIVAYILGEAITDTGDNITIVDGAEEEEEPGNE